MQIVRHLHKTHIRSYFFCKYIARIFLNEGCAVIFPKTPTTQF